MRDPGLREHRRAELQVGALVVAAFVALVWGVVWLSGADLAGRGLRVFGVADDAGQMSPGARVYLLGVDVGAVRALRIEERRVLVTLDVDYAGTLPGDTRGLILPSGFLGTQMVRLEPGSSDRPLASGDTIPLQRVPDLQALAGDLGDQATHLMEEAANVLSRETAREIRASSSALASAMRELEGMVSEQRVTLDRLLANLDRASEGLADAAGGPELGRTVARLDSLSADLARAGSGLDSASRSLASILGKVDGGEGTLGRLVHDEELYDKVAAAMENLQVVSEELALLAQDVRERPERYLKGVKFSVF